MKKTKNSLEPSHFPSLENYAAPVFVVAAAAAAAGGSDNDDYATSLRMPNMNPLAHFRYYSMMSLASFRLD